MLNVDSLSTMYLSGRETLYFSLRASRDIYSVDAQKACTMPQLIHFGQAHAHFLGKCGSLSWYTVPGGSLQNKKNRDAQGTLHHVTGNSMRFDNVSSPVSASRALTH